MSLLLKSCSILLRTTYAQSENWIWMTPRSSTFVDTYGPPDVNIGSILNNIINSCTTIINKRPIQCGPFNIWVIPSISGLRLLKLLFQSSKLEQVLLSIFLNIDLNAILAPIIALNSVDSIVLSLMSQSKCDQLVWATELVHMPMWYYMVNKSWAYS